MKKRFMITGGAGFIGSAVVRLLLTESAHEVLVVDKLTYAGNMENLTPVAGKYRFAQLDVCDALGLRRLFEAYRPQVVMHLAAESHVDRSIDGPSEFIKTNLVGTFTLLQCALEFWRSLPDVERKEFRFHHVSTDEVFGSLDRTGYFTETTPYAPTSPYSASKAGSDHLVRAWGHTFDLPVILSNCSNNYGPFQFPEKLIPLTILNAIEGKPIRVYGAGQNVRDWLYVEDHARALWLIAERGEPGEAYNVGGSSERANIDVVHAVCQVLDELMPDPRGHRARLIEFVLDRPGHDFRYAIDASKISRELGWNPRREFHSGIRETVQWYLDNKGWWERVRSGVYIGERLGVRA